MSIVYYFYPVVFIPVLFTSLSSATSHKLVPSDGRLRSFHFLKPTASKTQRPFISIEFEFFLSPFKILLVVGLFILFAGGGPCFVSRYPVGFPSGLVEHQVLCSLGLFPPSLVTTTRAPSGNTFSLVADFLRPLKSGTASSGPHLKLPFWAFNRFIK
jgi:hypothetical protein